jgi:glycerol-3-phosphate dehydrogenase (NAD(P)+)
LKTMPELAAELWPSADIAVLSGPTFATELALGLPGAAVIASDSSDLAAELTNLFSGSALRVYASTDPVGVALGGAIKNVIAIATGAIMGAGLGSNARAAVISRGLAEMTRLATALGARPETLAGLSGLGDLVLSCTDSKSRNYSLGFALGQGRVPSRDLTEGAHTVGPLLALAASHDVDMPIAAAVDAVLNKDLPLNEAVAALMRRPGKAE